MKFFFTALVLFSLALQTNAQLTTSKIFGGHMVLQRNKSVAVWGWCRQNAKVKLSFNGQTVSTKADGQGNWKVMLAPMKEGGPYVMEIASGKARLQYKDVMMGEVWICSGQSNMELVLKNADGYKAEQKIADQTTIRQFLVPQKMSLQNEKYLPGGEWINAAPNTIGNFTAVGYYFAKQLAAKLHVTIGLVHSSWGGTQAEDWISKESMQTSPGLKGVIARQPGTWDQVKAKVDTEIRKYAYKNKEVNFYTAGQLAVQPVSFFDNWQNGGTGAWKWQGKWSAYNGAGFMQRKVTLDSAHAKLPSVLKLGQTDADAEVYVNGNLVYTGVLPPGQPFQLPAGAWKPGDNSILLELLSNQKNQPWFGMGLNGDGRDINISFADTTLNLADNRWKLMADFSKPYHLELMPNNTVSTLYNGMINPLISLTMAGVIWYQGESNAGRAFEYRSVFALLITDWRSKWKTDFPFFFVQLPSFGPTQNSNQGSPWAELREAQTMALKLPNTGMAVTIDVGDANNLHPPAKYFVGYRLANEALSKVYGLAAGGESPLFRSAGFSGGYATVSFTGADSGLVIKDKYGYLKGFELAGANHKFYYAQAVLINNTVKVWCPQVPQPVAVRYAWSDSPIDANLFNSAGLPASPFRSDNWPAITEKSKLADN